MRIVPSPWRAEFNALLSSAKKEVRITAPFYGEDAIAGILNRAGKTVAKYFLLALSEQAVVARSQSTAAIALIRKDGSSSLRFIKNLHAKFIIVDKTTAIVTSSNLTRAGLESNVEMGIRVDDPKTVAELIRQFDGLWSKASVVDPATLADYAGLPTQPRGGHGGGKAFGPRIRLGKLAERPPSPDTPAPGWILIHSSKKYGGKDQDANPQAELKYYYRPGVPWHWTLPRPLKEDGPYRLLLAWDKTVFGEARVNITRDIDRDLRKDYNFAFVLLEYKPLKTPIAFSQLPLGNREWQHRSLIRLDERILAAYDKLAT